MGAADRAHAWLLPRPDCIVRRGAGAVVAGGHRAHHRCDAVRPRRRSRAADCAWGAAGCAGHCAGSPYLQPHAALCLLYPDTRRMGGEVAMAVADLLFRSTPGGADAGVSAFHRVPGTTDTG